MMLSLCASIAIVALRSLLWHTSVVLLWDGACREWYNGRAKGLAANDADKRTTLKHFTRKYNTPFGRAFAQRLRPHEQEPKRRSGSANKPNPFVTWAARVGALLALPMLVLASLPAFHLFRGGASGAAAVELAAAVSAILVGLVAARAVERAGPVATLLAALTGAVAGGIAAQLMLCKLLPFRLGPHGERGSKLQELAVIVR